MTNRSPTFRSHLPALAGSLIGTLISAVVGSHVGGPPGARYALVIGSLISGTASWWSERAIRRSNEVTRAKLAARRNRGRELTLGETQLIERFYGARFDKRNRGIPYRTIIALVVAPLFACALTVLVLDQLGARTVANIVPPARPLPAPVVTTFSPYATYAPTPEVRPTETQPPVPSAPTPSFQAPTISSTPTPSIGVTSASPSIVQSTAKPAQ